MMEYGYCGPKKKKAFAINIDFLHPNCHWLVSQVLNRKRADASLAHKFLANVEQYHCHYIYKL